MENMLALILLGVLLIIGSISTSSVNNTESERQKTQEQLEESVRLDEEIKKFQNQVKGRNTGEWTLGEHAAYASIRRRESER